MSLLDFLKTPAARVSRPAAGRPEIVELADPEEVTIPLEDPEGLLPPLVQAGEKVGRGQVIGHSAGGRCIHASIGGTVREISRIWTAAGHQVPAVVIERGEVAELTPGEALARCGLDPAAATRIQLLKAGGVALPWVETGIRQVVILGHDEEPTEHVQELLLQERAPLLVAGLLLLRDMAPQAEISLTVPRRLIPWARETFGEGLHLVGVADDYRRRLERVLVARLTGLTVPAEMPYHSQGIAVMTVETALAAQAALDGRPFLRKTLTVSGGHQDSPLTVRVPIGTSAQAVLDACGLEVEEGERVLAGGPMRGVALFTAQTPIDKYQHGIHLLEAAELAAESNLNCINCGRCVRACPVHLQVYLIGRYAQYNSPENAADLHPEACIECGLCAFVCPARRPLVHMVKLARSARRKTP